MAGDPLDVRDDISPENDRAGSALVLLMRSRNRLAERLWPVW